MVFKSKSKLNEKKNIKIIKKMLKYQFFSVLLVENKYFCSKFV